MVQQFRSVFTQNGAKSAVTSLHGPNYPPMADITTEEAGVAKLLKGVDPRAKHLDQTRYVQITSWIVYWACFSIYPSFSVILQLWFTAPFINICMDNAGVWERCVPSNYHPVILTCLSCKLLEDILCSQIRDYLDRHNILSPYQHGFRKKLSCESQLLVT